MNIFLRFFIALCMLAGFHAAHAAESNISNGATHTVVKGDTLSSIAKKFPGTTWRVLAQQNNITNPNRIFPNMVLNVKRANSALKTSVEKVEKITIGTTAPETTCDLKYGLEQLQFPRAMRSAIESKRLTQEHRTVPAREQMYVVSEGVYQYEFQVSKHCVYTKIVRMNTVLSESQEKLRDRLIVGSSLENHATSPPETTPGYSQAEEFRSIKHAIEEVLGPSYDVTRLTVALLRQQQHRREKYHDPIAILKARQ